MEWTTEKPTDTNWYWVWDGKEVNLAHINQHEGIKDYPFKVWIADTPYHINEFTYFMGPIAIPEPPKAA